MAAAPGRPLWHPRHHGAGDSALPDGHPDGADASILSMIIITIGAAFVMRGGALLIWGTDPYRLPVFTPGPPIKIFDAILTRQSAWVIAVTAVLLVILYWFFNHTLTGKTLRACADNPEAAQLMGISPRRMALLAFGRQRGHHRHRRHRDRPLHLHDL